jgi:hypothetical protein
LSRSPELQKVSENKTDGPQNTLGGKALSTIQTNYIIKAVKDKKNNQNDERDHQRPG